MLAAVNGAGLAIATMSMLVSVWPRLPSVCVGCSERSGPGDDYHVDASISFAQLTSVCVGCSERGLAIATMSMFVSVWPRLTSVCVA